MKCLISNISSGRKITGAMKDDANYERTDIIFLKPIFSIFFNDIWPVADVTNFRP